MWEGVCQEMLSKRFGTFDKTDLKRSGGGCVQSYNSAAITVYISLCLLRLGVQE